uniref:Uncharacterized protein n=1 Tax=Lates calcarifer TaxID=8187 RepID=A0A4W6C712_LATCA
ASSLTLAPESRLFALTLSSASSSSCCNLRSLGSHPSLQFLDLLLSTFHGYLLSFIQTVLTGVLLLLHLVSAASLSLQGGLQSVHHSLMVTLGLFHLLILLSQFTLNVSLHLVELQLSSKDLTLLMLQRSLKEQTLLLICMYSSVNMH